MAPNPIRLVSLKEETGTLWEKIGIYKSGREALECKQPYQLKSWSWTLSL